MPKKKSATKMPSLTTGEVFALASKYEVAQKTAAAADADRREAANAIVGELERRKTSALESDEFGAFTRITKVQNESVVYDEATLYKALTPAQRREAFDYSIDISILPEADRKALNKALIDLLSPAQRKAARRHRLNVDRLSAAVQEGIISQDVVAEHAEVVKSAAYIRISHGSGS